MNATPIKPTDNTIINSDGDISGGNLSRDGRNLFHSFEAFGLDAGQIANFLSTPDIRNILGRVTGGNPSIIDGLIQVTGGNPSLYLMNPAGIVFGANASLNVPADFTATTATAIGFNNNWFNAFGENNYQDLIGDPNQFAFDLTQHGAIINDGNLSVSAGNSLTLLGGSVTNNGTLNAPEGRITIASIPGQNLVKISHRDSLLSLEIDPKKIPENGEIRAIDLPKLLTGVEGETIANGTIDTSGSIGGEINILGDRIIIESALIDASGTNGGGNIRIGGGYRGGENVPNAEFTNIGENALIRANALDSGNGGRVILWADDTTVFLGDIFSEGGLRSGSGGFVEVSGKRKLEYRGITSTKPNSESGDFGMLLLDPDNFSIQAASAGLPDVATFNAILGTSLTLADISILPESALELSLTSITYDASQNIIISQLSDGILDLLPAPSAQFTAGGSILLLDSSLAANALTLSAGDRILSHTPSSPLSLSTQSDLTLSASEILLPTTTLSTNGGNATLTSLNGSTEIGNIFTTGGDIDLQATDSIATGRLDSAHSHFPLVTADAGDIQIQAGGDIDIGDRIRSHGILSGNGGDVRLEATGSISLSLGAGTTGYNGGDFTAIAGNNFFSGGDIVTAPTLLPRNILIQTGGNIGDINLNAVAGNFGNLGGTISLNAGGDIAIGNVLVDAQNGLGGTIALTAGGTIRTRTLSARSYTLWPPLPWAGGEINLTALDNILIKGVVQTDGSVSIATQGNLAIQGIASPGDFSLQAEVITIATGTPLSIANPLTSQSFSVGSIVANGSPITNLTLANDTTLPGLQYIRIPPSTSPTPASAPNPIAITPASNLETAIAQALEQPLTTATVETSEGEAIAHTWGNSFTIWVRPITNNQQPTTSYQLPLAEEGEKTISVSSQSDRAVQLDRQLEIDFDQYFEERDIPKNPVSTAKIRDSLETIEEQLGKTFAIFYVVPRDIETGEAVLDLALFLPHQAPIFTVSEPFRRGEAQEVVKEFRQAIPTLNEEYYPKSRWLHDRIIAPMRAHLEKVDAIAFALGDDIRGLPVAALHDGEKFLIERHATGIIPSFSLIDARWSPAWNRKVLAMGASKLSGRELPAVERELEAISRHFPTTTIELNEDFSFEQTRDRIAGAEILHLATHAEIATNIGQSSAYIEFWDGRISAAEFRQLNLDRVALAVLSACDTGRGNFPELGFAGIAHALGVRSAIASLWRVNDEKTADFMEVFYEHLADSDTPTLAESLQQAQLGMVSDGLHPYYWSSFAAIGTPW
ncbi:MAG: CHAT domain-containing protein [Cyanobacteria bacterium SBLK]|nr:CHAT domain-containing protein [Cyanobacteria bacterium SBLK]